MGAYSILNKSPVQVSRDSYVHATNGTSDDIDRYAEIGSLQRIASALERIANKLDCRTTADAARAIVTMEKRLAKKYPLVRKAKP